MCEQYQSMYMLWVMPWMLVALYCEWAEACLMSGKIRQLGIYGYQEGPIVVFRTLGCGCCQHNLRGRSALDVSTHPG